jgi:hypothetical protein
MTPHARRVAREDDAAIGALVRECMRRQTVIRFEPRLGVGVRIFAGLAIVADDGDLDTSASNAAHVLAR